MEIPDALRRIAAYPDRRCIVVSESAEVVLSIIVSAMKPPGNAAWIAEYRISAPVPSSSVTTMMVERTATAVRCSCNAERDVLSVVFSEAEGSVHQSVLSGEVSSP